jgi:hypothetical protein
MQARFAVDSFYSEETQGTWVGTAGLFYCTRKERRGVIPGKLVGVGREGIRGDSTWNGKVSQKRAPQQLGACPRHSRLL